MTTTHKHRPGMTYYTPNLEPMHIYAAWDDVTNQDRRVLVAGYDPEVPAAQKEIAPGTEFIIPIEVDDVAKVGSKLARARAKTNEVLEEARLTGLAALAAGMTEVDVSKSLGVDRMTVRKWQGKR